MTICKIIMTKLQLLTNYWRVRLFASSGMKIDRYKQSHVFYVY